MDWTWGLMAASLVGTVLNAQKKRLGFVFWSIANPTWALLCFMEGQHAQAVLWLVYTGLSVWGWVHWGRDGDADCAVVAVPVIDFTDARGKALGEAGRVAPDPAVSRDYRA